MNSAIPVSGATRIRVRYCECDPMGVAHHAAYLPWLEIGRTELLRSAGRSYAKLEEQGLFLVIVEVSVRYRRSLKYDDVIEVRTRLARATRVKLLHEYEIVIVEREGVPVDERATLAAESCAVANTTLAAVGRDGRPIALPDWLAGS